MTKYEQLAITANKVIDVETAAAKIVPVLKARLEAVVKSQEADIMGLQSDLTEAEDLVDIQRGYLTSDVEEYLLALNTAKDVRDLIAEDLNVANEGLEELQEELKNFS